MVRAIHWSVVDLATNVIVTVAGDDYA